MGHGHVLPNFDGHKAACGGADKCNACKSESVWLATFIDVSASRIRGEQERRWAERTSLTKKDVEEILFDQWAKSRRL